MEQSKRRKKFTGNPAQNKLLILIFASAIVPAGIIALCLYYLIFNLLAWQIGIPEAVAYNLIPVARRVNIIILIALPVIFFIIWMIALELSNRIVGPLSRLEKELDARISGEKKGPLRVREKDTLKPLVDKINGLIDR